MQKKFLTVLLLICTAGCFFTGCAAGDSDNTVLGTTVPTATQAIEPTAEPTATPSPTPSPEPTATLTPTPSPEPTATPSPTPSPEPTATPSLTPSPEPTATPSPTPSPEPTATPSPTPSPEPTATPSPEPTATPSPTPSPTPTATPSPTPTATPSPTPSPLPTATPTPTPIPGITAKNPEGITFVIEVDEATEQMTSQKYYDADGNLLGQNVVIYYENGKFKNINCMDASGEVILGTFFYHNQKIGGYTHFYNFAEDTTLYLAELKSMSEDGVATCKFYSMEPLHGQYVVDNGTRVTSVDEITFKKSADSPYGAVAERIDWYGFGVHREYKIAESYDANGREKRLAIYDANTNALLRYEEYTYHSYEQINEKLNYDLEGKQTYRMCYDADGNCTENKAFSYNAYGEYTISDNLAGVSETYNQDGNIIRRTVRLQNSDISKTFTQYSYKNGSLDYYITEEYKTVDGIISVVRRVTYDANGNVMDEKTY